MSHHPFPWREPFLAALREWPVVQQACVAVDIDRSTAYRARHADKAFAEAWDDAMEAGIDKAEREAFRRAVEGTEKGVWHMGSLVGTERVYSDALLSLVLKGRRKKVYADRTELTGADGGPMLLDDTARAARMQALLQVAAARKADDDQSDIA